MSRTASKPPAEPEPTWEIARLFPHQGEWTEWEYLTATEHTNQLIELSDGRLEFLPMPTAKHQRILLYLYELLKAFAGARGEILVAPLRVRLWKGKIREPDIIFILTEHQDRAGDRVWDGADLVMEIVSEDEPERDLVIKREEYARAGITEYWIVNPQAQRITVLKLAGQGYRVHGEFAPGERAASALLPGFEVDVTAALAAGRRA